MFSMYGASLLLVLNSIVRLNGPLDNCMMSTLISPVSRGYVYAMEANSTRSFCLLYTQVLSGNLYRIALTRFFNLSSILAINWLNDCAALRIL